MSMFRKIRKRAKEDKGNSVIILGLMLIMALLLVGGMLLDISKAYQLKSSYIDSAKKATQAAIREQSTEGKLRPEAAGEAVRVYENIARPSVINTDGYFSQCRNSDVVLKVTYIDEYSGDQLVVGEISRSQVGKNDDARAISQKMGAYDPSKISKMNDNLYTGIRLELTEGTENVILPGAFKITQGNSEDVENIRCQEMDISARANIFVGDEDYN